MIVSIIGNSHFGPILTKQLNKYDRNNTYKFYNTSEKKLDKVKFVLNLPFIDVVYSIGATLSGGGALNLALKFNKKIVQHFMGSDVIKAKEDLYNKDICRKLIKQSQYLCEVNWIEEELLDMGIEASVKVMMAYESFIDAKLFNRFSVLTYLGRGKEDFYGVKEFIQLAKDFPTIKFKIAGIEQYSNLPSNITCLGWINMIDELQKSTVYIRNTKHDGLGFSVVEALSLGRIVFRNYNFPYVYYFNGYADLKEQFSNVFEKYMKRELALNTRGIDFVKENFNDKQVLKELVKVLCE